MTLLDVFCVRFAPRTFTYFHISVQIVGISHISSHNSTDGGNNSAKYSPRLSPLISGVMEPMDIINTFLILLNSINSTSDTFFINSESPLPTVELASSPYIARYLPLLYHRFGLFQSPQTSADHTAGAYLMFGISPGVIT